ncbi:hypothetical protein KEM48_014422 [Puccinia striiformis f. sp. tritici PST-130]|uniref:Uncharacterized protein n=1 Tax=Puccinia striiformis f. sp. tritici PST-78 TaxID=1165861 RepID=A0A0L0UYI9_9BASI|nr:hypothetical protein Pst134EB_028272 [Puccinia striiformis f. sp. tritici]KAI9631372.1 hypothetical protein KEM48_014422 [Puccinia striiformis f. sp. tritici PST-130]KNE92122.1 hypothetical protein PSTG_14502 [Puccinia striiformis f. sp. tritici PST-78]
MSINPWELGKRSQKIKSVINGLRGLSHKHDLPPDDFMPDEMDPNVTVEDMRDYKMAMLMKLRCHFLPSMKKEITSLSESLHLTDSEQGLPNPDVELILAILSKLDRTLESTKSSIVILAHTSPLPDGKQDHHLGPLKSFRCSQIRIKIQTLIEVTIISLLEFCDRLLGFCLLAIASVDPTPALKEASDSEKEIRILISKGRDLIDQTIAWSRKSDWAIIQEDWLSATGTLNRVLEDLTRLANLARQTIGSTDQRDLVEHTDVQNGVKATQERMVILAGLIIPLVKLVRIFVRKLLAMIPKKPIFHMDTTINSEALEIFRGEFQSIAMVLANSSRRLHCIQRNGQIMTIGDRNEIRGGVEYLKEMMRSTAIISTSHLIPLLHRGEYARSESDPKVWFLVLEKSWDTVFVGLSDLISSYDVGPELQLERED